MATLLTLATKMNRLARDVEKLGNEAAKQVALEVITDLAYNTPVDTGEHVSSWEIGIGSPPTAHREPYAPGSGGDTAAANASRAVGAAKRVLRGKSRGQSIFISNAAPAIVQLNNGSSAKAPAGFVERALLKAKLAARRVRING